jgi:hypothetical protein
MVLRPIWRDEAMEFRLAPPFRSISFWWFYESCGCWRYLVFHFLESPWHVLNSWFDWQLCRRSILQFQVVEQFRKFSHRRWTIFDGSSMWRSTHKSSKSRNCSISLFSQLKQCPDFQSVSKIPISLVWHRAKIVRKKVSILMRPPVHKIWILALEPSNYFSYKNISVTKLYSVNGMFEKKTEINEIMKKNVNIKNHFDLKINTLFSVLHRRAWSFQRSFLEWKLTRRVFNDIRNQV